MSEPSLIIMLFLMGVAVLTAEIFLPSYGILTMVGLGLLGTSVYKAYMVSPAWGHGSVAATVIVLPAMAIIAVKTFHKTPWGRRISPPNPVARTEEFAPDYQELKSLVGRSGRSATPLRPVGFCTVDGRRLNCVAEMGVIDAGVEVQVVGVRGHELVVRIRQSQGKTIL